LQTIGAIPVAHIDSLTAEKLGSAALCEDVKLSDDSRILKITGVNAKAKTVTILCRGSNSLVSI
jgi:T-complex protein 1 subunit delta